MTKPVASIGDTGILDDGITESCCNFYCLFELGYSSMNKNDVSSGGSREGL